MSNSSPTFVTDEDISAALRTDKGPNATLVSWSLEDLASDFDGATSNIKSVRVRYSASEDVAGEEPPEEACYVLKANRSRDEESEYFLSMIFSKEVKFYQEVIPALNAVLKDAGLEPLCFPKCFFSRLEKGKDIIIFENLREKSYKMKDKGLGIDATHASLVLKELAKIHAASALLQAKEPQKDLLDRFDCLQKEWTQEFNMGCDFGAFLETYLSIGLAMFEKFQDCDQVVRWVRKIKPDAWKIYNKQLERKAPFALVLHGDVWINNMLFRYDQNNLPVDVKFLDVQGCRKASVALDLQHFLNLNVTGPERRPNLSSLLSVYHKAFDEVMRAGGLEAPFTCDDLRQEYLDKGMYGVLYAIMWLPNMVRRPVDCQDILDTGADSKTSQLNNILQMVDNNPLLKPRIMSVIDEWTECGLIS